MEKPGCSRSREPGGVTLAAAMSAAAHQAHALRESTARQGGSGDAQPPGAEATGLWGSSPRGGTLVSYTRGPRLRQRAPPTAGWPLSQASRPSLRPTETAALNPWGWHLLKAAIVECLGNTGQRSQSPAGGPPGSPGAAALTPAPRQPVSRGSFPPKHGWLATPPAAGGARSTIHTLLLLLDAEEPHNGLFFEQ